LHLNPLSAMKKLYTLSLLVFLFVSVGMAQTPAGSFVITENGTAQNTASYITAIENADMESYRLQNERVKLSFDNGLTFELLSANEMAAAGMNVNASEYRQENPVTYRPPVLHLIANGKIAAEYQTNTAKNR